MSNSCYTIKLTIPQGSSRLEKEIIQLADKFGEYAETVGITFKNELCMEANFPSDDASKEFEKERKELMRVTINTDKCQLI